MSYDGNYYIFNTCDKALQNNGMLCQAVANKLFVVDLSKKFQGINRLERLLASRGILFKKVIVMPKCKSLKMKGSICNIPVTEIDINCNKLPRPADSNGLLIVMLKRKLEYKSHLIFEAVRPALVVQILEFLKLHNHLYLDIEINYNNISVNMLGCHNGSLEESEIYLQLLRSLNEPIEVEVELSTNKEIHDDPLSKFRAPSIETTIISEAPSNCELEQEITITPGEGKQPILVLNAKLCEELVHLHLFPSGRYGYQIERKIPLSPSKCFDQILLHYCQKFVVDSDYIFCAYSVLRKVQLSSQINIAMKKVISNNLTEGMLIKSFKQRVNC